MILRAGLKSALRLGPVTDERLKRHKLPLPLDQYANWRNTTLVFDPKEIMR